MPRYYFHVHDGSSMPDLFGTELPDLQTAQREAVERSGRLLVEHKDDFWAGEEWKLDVADGKGLILFTLIFMAVVAPAGGGGKPKKRGH